MLFAQQACMATDQGRFDLLLVRHHTRLLVDVNVTRLTTKMELHLRRGAPLTSAAAAAAAAKKCILTSGCFTQCLSSSCSAYLLLTSAASQLLVSAPRCRLFLFCFSSACRIFASHLCSAHLLATSASRLCFTLLLHASASTFAALQLVPIQGQFFLGESDGCDERERGVSQGQA